MLSEGFTCIPTEISLSLKYGRPKVSCNKRTKTYFGRQSAMKEF